MIHSRFIIREVLRSSRQATLFVLCVILSLTTLTAFNGFSKSVNRSLLSDARKLHAADIIIRSYDPISAALSAAVNDRVDRRQVELAKYHEFYSVVRSPDEQKSQLTQLKIVDSAYPFYGEVRLKSGRPLHEVLKTGQIVVAQPILDALGLTIGDPLKVGFTTLTIAGVVLSEPDRPVNLFSFGPRIFVAAEDLEALDLIRKGSRIKYVYLLKVIREEQLDPIADNLRKIALFEQESVETYKSARSSLKRFLDNFIFDLKLVGLFILVIAGFGIQGTLTAFLNEKHDTIAIMKTVGATNRYITLHFALIVIMLGLIGIALGFGAGIGMQFGLARVLSSVLPPGMQLHVSWAGVLEGIILGLCVVAMFAFAPMYRLKEMRPVMILRKERARLSKKWPYYLTVAGLLLFFFGLVFWHMQDLKIGLYFIAAIGGLVIVASLLTHFMLAVLKRLPFRGLAIRQAAKGLFRPGNATKPTVITLTASLCAIFLIYLIEQNLDATFVQSYPPDAPNMFFLDIQPSQREGFSQTVDRTVKFYPIVRARVVAVNDDKIDPKKERQKRRDNFSRVFNLTYRNYLLGDEKIVAGKNLFRKDWQETQVSIMDTVAEMRRMGIGDKITFKIQGVPLEARISSIRTRPRESIRPFFYFVFEEKTLRDAPQTIFTALKVARDQVGPLQNRIVSRFPNISVIDLSDTIQIFARLLKQLSGILRFFSLLSIAAGILILISAVFATRAARITESVYYKILGAKKRFVLWVFALENVLMGLLSGLLALITAQIGAFLLCRFVFDITYQPFLPTCIVMIAVTLLLVVTTGMISSRSILAKKPVTYLREQADA